MGQVSGGQTNDGYLAIGQGSGDQTNEDYIVLNEVSDNKEHTTALNISVHIELGQLHPGQNENMV